VRSEALPFYTALLDGLPPAGTYAGAGLKPIDLNAVSAPNFPVLNQISGDASTSRNWAHTTRLQVTTTSSSTAFGTWGQSPRCHENYRLPHIAATPAQSGGVAQPHEYFYPYGFTPLEAIARSITASPAACAVCSSVGTGCFQYQWPRRQPVLHEDSVNTTAYARASPIR